MALLRHRDPDVTTDNGDRTYADETAVRRDADEEVVERAGPSPGIVRALCTLAGVAGAGFLLWLASTFDQTTSGDYWPVVGLIAAAGLVLGLSQLIGGWTKWGIPTMSPTMLLLAWLPTAVVGTWVLLATQPDGGWQKGRFVDWTDSIGVNGLVSGLGEFWPAIPLAIGLVLAFCFDTTGPRTGYARRTETVERTAEPVATPVPADDADTEHVRADDDRIDDDTSVAEELRARDADADGVDDDRETVAADRSTRRDDDLL